MSQSGGGMGTIVSYGMHCMVINLSETHLNIMEQVLVIGMEYTLLGSMSPGF